MPVLEAIYAAFGISWDDMFGIDPRGRDLVEEAIWLARVLLLQFMPSEAEVQGLLAIMLHSEARRSARRALDGRYVPLSRAGREAMVTSFKSKRRNVISPMLSARALRQVSARSCNSVGYILSVHTLTGPTGRR